MMEILLRYPPNGSNVEGFETANEAIAKVLSQEKRIKQGKRRIWSELAVSGKHKHLQVQQLIVAAE